MEGYKLRQAFGGESYPLYRDLLSPRKSALQMGALVIVFVYLYASVWMALATTWIARDDYSYGFLVPLISLYLVWYRRELLKHLPIQPAYRSGMLIVLAAGAMLVLGRAGNMITLQELSLVAMIAGLVLCLLGKDYLKAMGFPIAYLLFMVPIADELIAPLHWSFQLLTAKMGVAFLQAMGFSVFLENQYIMLPSITLEVAKACSGINYLISIIALGVPLAYVTQKNIWSRVVLVVSAVTIGIIGNWIRVAAIGTWAYYGGQVVHGPFHVFQALFVSQLGFIALFAGAWILAKVPAAASSEPHRGSTGSTGPAGQAGGPVGGQVSRFVASNSAQAGRKESHVMDQRRLLERSWLGVILILLGVSAYLTFHEHGPVPLKVKFAMFPTTIGDWKNEDGVLRDPLFKVPNADEELIRVYRDPAGNEVQLYLAYFESQRHPKKLFNYITAQLHQDAVPVNIQVAQSQSITVNRTSIQSEHRESPAFFWYDLNGKTYTDRYRAVLANALNNLAHGRTNGALVLIAGVDRKDGNKISDEEEAFIRALAPVLRWYLPDGKDYGKDNADTRRN